MINVDIDMFIMIRKLFILVLCTVNMETSRTLSNVLENFQKKAQEFCCQPNIIDQNKI